MDITATLGGIERILSIAGPLVVQLVGEGRRDQAKYVLDTINGVVDMANKTIDGAEIYAEELREIEQDLIAYKDRSGMTEEVFDKMAARVTTKVADLRATVEARRAASE